MPTIHPPTVDEQACRCLAYVFLATVGIVVLISPREELLQTQLGFWTAMAWGIAMATGIPAGAAALFGRYRYEYTLLPLFTAALLVANVYAWYMIFAVSHDIDAVPRSCVASAMVLLLYVRLRTLHRLIKVLKWTKPLHRP